MVKHPQVSWLQRLVWDHWMIHQVDIRQYSCQIVFPVPPKWRNHNRKSATVLNICTHLSIRTIKQHKKTASTRFAFTFVVIKSVEHSQQLDLWWRRGPTPITAWLILTGPHILSVSIAKNPILIKQFLYLICWIAFLNLRIQDPPTPQKQPPLLEHWTDDNLMCDSWS